MRAKLLLALSPCLAAAACDDSQPTQPRSPIVVRSEAQEGLHKLNAMNLAIALKRAIHASGYRCKRTTDAGYVQEHNNLSMWTASCDDGTQWAIFAGPDGSAQVRRCQDLAQFRLPACNITKRPPA